MTLISSECINNFEFIFNFNNVNFNEALVLCRNQGARLTIPRSIDWHDSFGEFFDSIGHRTVWIGLKDFDDIGGNLVATRFLDIERRPNPYSQRPSETPWLPLEPDDATGIENCVETRTDSLFNADRCNTFNTFVCEKYCGVLPDNFIFDECVDSTQLFFNPNERTFDAANADCEAFDPNAHLAIPTDNGFFNRMTSFLSSVNRQTDTFIGLRDFAEEGGLSTDRFQTLNGDVLNFYNVGINVFPWDVSQPNDLDGNQKCATILSEGSQLMDDNNCLAQLQSVCQRPCITDAPTISPTNSPTNLPTSVTRQPTISPTRNPTLLPSFSPTSPPLSSPTSFPTTTFITSECVNNREFFFNPQSLPFDSAVSFCRDNDARLTIPRTIDWFNSYNPFVNSIGSLAVWVGLKDVNDLGGFLGAARFRNIEGQKNPFSEFGFLFPWASGEPNDANFGENCVETRAGDGLLNDRDCTVSNPSVCERYCGDLPENFVFDECIDSIQLFFNPNRRTFDAANADCEAFDPDAHLATPSGIEIFNRMRSFLNTLPIRSTDTFIGLRDFRELGQLSTTRFRTLDGELLSFYNVILNNFPWDPFQPNDLDGTDNCATIFSGGSQLMNDDNCLAELESLCQRPCVTSAPTLSPTIFPTVRPTKLPTISPTSLPSESPTPVPTSSPTNECVNNLEFILVPESNSFVSMASTCRSLGGRLTIPRSVDWFNAFDIFFNSIGRQPAWVGLRDFADIGGRNVATRFLNIEGRPNPYSHQALQPPWSQDQPNDANEIENCVQVGEDGLLNDVSCNSFNAGICERYCGEVPDNFVFDECTNNVQLFFNPNRRTFDAANADCEAFGPTAHLAIPSDERSFDRMRNFLLDIPGKLTSTFIGLRDFTEQGGSSAARFLTGQGDLLDFYNVDRGNFPWGPGEPNDSGGEEMCATMFFGSRLLNDISCLSELQSLCQQPCISSDTGSPSNQPMPALTPRPTFNPTSFPTTVSEGQSSTLTAFFAVGLVTSLVIFLVLIGNVLRKKGQSTESQEDHLGTEEVPVAVVQKVD